MNDSMDHMRYYEQQERDSLSERAKYWERERDALSRLYYGLWIVFLGGFVLSLRVPIHWCWCWRTALLVAFRVLAIVGTGLNFVIQDRSMAAMSSSSYATMHELNREFKEASEKYAEAAKWNRWVAKLEPVLKIVGFAFLLIALVGSFVVAIP